MLHNEIGIKKYLMLQITTFKMSGTALFGEWTFLAMNESIRLNPLPSKHVTNTTSSFLFNMHGTLEMQTSCGSNCMAKRTRDRGQDEKNKRSSFIINMLDILEEWTIEGVKKTQLCFGGSRVVAMVFPPSCELANYSGNLPLFFLRVNEDDEEKNIGSNNNSNNENLKRSINRGLVIGFWYLKCTELILGETATRLQEEAGLFIDTFQNGMFKASLELENSDEVDNIIENAIISLISHVEADISQVCCRPRIDCVHPKTLSLTAPVTFAWQFQQSGLIIEHAVGATNWYDGWTMIRSVSQIPRFYHRDISRLIGNPSVHHSSAEMYHLRATVTPHMSRCFKLSRRDMRRFKSKSIIINFFLLFLLSNIFSI
jgi:hypothetical protein